jgi:hypothetical protein
MPGISDLTVWYEWQLYGAIQGQWSVDGGALQDSGATVSGLSDGPHVVGFSAVMGIDLRSTPVPQTVTITDGNNTFTAGTYNQTGPESLLESARSQLIETDTYALDTILSTPFLLAASSLDAAFSAFGPKQPGQNQGAAFTEAQLMSQEFGEVYNIILEGGQVESDFATLDEIEAFADYVAPHLTGSQPYAGGVPVRCGYSVTRRALKQGGVFGQQEWTIQRGMGFSFQGAIDAGYVAGLPDLYYLDTPPAPKKIGGLIVSAGGNTFATQANPAQGPGNLTGMPAGFDIPTNPLHVPYNPITGYPVNGGANISQLGRIAGCVTLNTINNDGTINPALFYNLVIPPPPGTIFPTMGNFNAFCASGANTDYYCSNDYHYLITWREHEPYWYPPGEFLAFASGGNYEGANASNIGINTLPWALIFWFGIGSQGVPASGVPFDSYAGNGISPPVDRNAKSPGAFHAEDYELFWLK